MDISNNSVITNIVISGGSVAGLTFYGALKESNKKKIWEYKNIESIYGTSFGSILGFLI